MQRKTVTAILGSATAAVFLVGALGGCASPAPHSHAGAGHPIIAPHTASPTPTATATPTATPTPTGPPPLPANALFAISATVTAKNGAAADLYQVVYAPAAQNPTDVALLNSQCNISGQPKWQATYPGSLFLDTTITATLHAGSPAFSKADAVNFWYSWGASAFSGSYGVWEADCAPGYIHIPGTIHGVATVPSSNPATATYGWANNPSNYGFVGGGNDPGGPDSGGTALVSNCVIQLSAAAKAAGPKEYAWATQAYVKANGCTYNA